MRLSGGGIEVLGLLVALQADPPVSLDDEAEVEGGGIGLTRRGPLTWKAHDIEDTHLLVFLQHGLLLQKFLHQDLLLPLPLLVVLLRLLRRSQTRSSSPSFCLCSISRVASEDSTIQGTYEARNLTRMNHKV